MKKELKVIYQAIKPIAVGIFEGLIGGAFAAPSLVRRLKRVDKKEDNSPTIEECAVASTIGFFSCGGINLKSLIFSMIDFQEGNIKRGLIFAIPLMTNAISGIYELYRWAKNKVRERESSEWKISKLETELIPSQAKNIETAIQYMSFDKDGSLRTNGNYGEEEKRRLYEKIVEGISKGKITSLRERLGEGLAYLRENEKNSPDAIKYYFKEKFGIPISNYNDLDLFYQVMLTRETEKQKRVLGIFRKKIDLPINLYTKKYIL